MKRITKSLMAIMLALVMFTACGSSSALTVPKMFDEMYKPFAQGDDMVISYSKIEMAIANSPYTEVTELKDRGLDCLQIVSDDSDDRITYFFYTDENNQHLLEAISYTKTSTSKSVNVDFFKQENYINEPLEKPIYTVEDITNDKVSEVKTISDQEKFLFKK